VSYTKVFNKYVANHQCLYSDTQATHLTPWLK